MSRRRIIGLQAGTMLFVLSLSIAACTQSASQFSDQLTEVAPGYQESWRVEFRVTERGVIRMVLAAPYMVRYDEPDSLYTRFSASDSVADRVVVTFYDSLGALTGTLTANVVLLDEASYKMIASGDVILASETGRRLESERIIWDDASKQIEAPGFLSLTTEDENIRGYRLRADEDLDSWEIERVTGTVAVRTTQ